jgi:hypothetical protein
MCPVWVGALYIQVKDGTHGSLTGKIRLSFINSDLLYSGALKEGLNVLIFIMWNEYP